MGEIKLNGLTNMSLYLAHPAASGDPPHPVPSLITHKWQNLATAQGLIIGQ